MAAIEVKDLQRSFEGGVTAVAGVDLEVAEGEIFSFLGPNGAGKTTTVRMLTTLLRPTGGSAAVAGFDVVKEPGRGPPDDRRRAPGGGARPADDRPRADSSAGDAARAPARRGRASAPSELLAPRRTARGSGPARRHLLRRHAAPARSRHGTRPRTQGPLPRRADDRPRPGQPQDDLGGGPASSTTRARRSSSPPSTSRRPTSSPTASGSSRRPDRRRGHARLAQGRGRQAAARAGARRGLRRDDCERVLAELRPDAARQGRAR